MVKPNGQIKLNIANASGCSSAYGGSTPSTPYTTDSNGHGPAWAMSLFEDNAEYAYGMLLGARKVRDRLKEKVSRLSSEPEFQKVCSQGLWTFADAQASKQTTKTLVEALERFVAERGQNCDRPDVLEIVHEILQDKEYLSKKSYWAFGGDGWAYDIGYGGLDHVLASGEDVNVLVLDTEVYSNTGGQSSKSTPASAIAKFAATGKRTRKKDLGMMAMSYGYVYVAQVAMGYDPEQTVRAFREAEAYPGPSLIIAYGPCIEHGIKAGMSKSQAHMKEAVEAGYWHLYRYNPLLQSQGKNPFSLDSKEPTGDFEAFLKSENRYMALTLAEPEHAQQMYEKTRKDAISRYLSYKRLADQPMEG